MQPKTSPAFHLNSKPGPIHLDGSWCHSQQAPNPPKRSLFAIFPPRTQRTLQMDRAKTEGTDFIGNPLGIPMIFHVFSFLPENSRRGGLIFYLFSEFCFPKDPQPLSKAHPPRIGVSRAIFLFKHSTADRHSESPTQSHRHAATRPHSPTATQPPSHPLTQPT